LIVMHLPLLRRRTLHRLLPHYALMSLPALLGAVGLVTLIETAHHQLVKSATQGPAMRLFGVELESDEPLPWVAALALIAAGIVLGRAWAPRVSAAFDEAANGTVSRGRVGE
jgi:branched-chain amino acid transport system permease protein